MRFFLKRNNQRKPFFFPPVLHVQGRKKEEQCRSKRHRSVFFFFFYMKRRRFKQNAPFHLSPARRQNASICKAALNYLLFISIVSLPILVSAPLVGRVFHFSPWPLIYAIEPSID